MNEFRIYAAFNGGEKISIEKHPIVPSEIRDMLPKK